ncbi:MAG: Nif11 family protein [Eubacteriales bacterium]|nr:Nif11 family protein [Eubacteriales bacterium]
MSKMNELYQKVTADSDLQARFNRIMATAEKDGAEATEAKLTDFAKAAGYEISVEEMNAFFKDLAEKENGALSESELDMVAGGKSTGQILLTVCTGGYACGVSSMTKRGDLICDDPGSEFGL